MSKISYLFKTTKLPNGGELEEYNESSKYYWLDNHLHREDGPAIEGSDGHKAWFINDERMPCKTQKQFEQLMKLKAFW